MPCHSIRRCTLTLAVPRPGGDSPSVLSGEADPLTWVVRLLGLGATLAVVWLVNGVARDALRSEVDG